MGTTGATALWASSSTGQGVMGCTTSGTGVRGKSASAKGVRASSGSGAGVRGQARSGVGLCGTTTSPMTGYAFGAVGRVRLDACLGVATIAATRSSVTVTPGSS